MSKANWKTVQSGIKQIRATLNQGNVPAALTQLSDFERAVSTRRTQNQIDSELVTIDTSLAGFNGSEQAYHHCMLFYNRDWYMQELDVDFKIAVTNYLHLKWPTRNVLWSNIYNRDINHLYLL